MTAWLHLRALDEDGQSSLINTWCGTKLNRFNAIMETADEFTLEAHQPCRKC